MSVNSKQSPSFYNLHVLPANHPKKQQDMVEQTIKYNDYQVYKLENLLNHNLYNFNDQERITRVIRKIKENNHVRDNAIIVSTVNPDYIKMVLSRCHGKKRNWRTVVGTRIYHFFSRLFSETA